MVRLWIGEGQKTKLIVFLIMVSLRIVWFLLQRREYIDYTSYICLNTCKLFVVDFWINSGFCRISGDCVSELNITFFGFINITIYTLFIYLSYSSLRTFRILISKHPHWGTWYLLIRPKTLSPYGGVLP